MVLWVIDFGTPLQLELSNQITKEWLKVTLLLLFTFSILLMQVKRNFWLSVSQVRYLGNQEFSLPQVIQFINTSMYQFMSWLSKFSDKSKWFCNLYYSKIFNILSVSFWYHTLWHYVIYIFIFCLVTTICAPTHPRLSVVHLLQLKEAVAPWLLPTSYSLFLQFSFLFLSAPDPDYSFNEELFVRFHNSLLFRWTHNNTL